MFLTVQKSIADKIKMTTKVMISLDRNKFKKRKLKASILFTYLNIAAPLNRMWNKHAMGWFAVWNMPMSTFAPPSLSLSPVLEGEPTIVDAVVTLELEFYCSFLTVFVLLSPMLMLKSNPSS